MALSSDEIIKREIIDKVGYSFGNIRLRIFPESSNDDQVPYTKGGLTFNFNNVNYGSCDAAWYISKRTYIDSNGTCDQFPVIALEGTDALQRGSTGNAQYQRFHHALGAVKNGLIGIYYLKPGIDEIQPDLFGMAYFATKREKGYYLIIQNLEIVREILHLVESYGYNSQQLKEYLDNYQEYMYSFWWKNKFSQYNYDWDVFAKKRSTLMINDKLIVKHAGRMKRNFTDSSQRAGHIAVGEMYLTKYFFYDKSFYYLFPRMTHKDLSDLDSSKSTDKEWFLLRNEENVYIKTMDDLAGLSIDIRNRLLDVKEAPLKGNALKEYKECVTVIVEAINNGSITVL